MIDYRNILRLHSEGHSQRAMERDPLIIYGFNLSKAAGAATEC